MKAKRKFAAAAAAAAAALIAYPGFVAAAPKPCPKTVIVTDAGDDGSPYQLRTAIAEVCNGGKVELAPSVGTIGLWVPIPVDKNVKVGGSGQTVQSEGGSLFTISMAGTLVLGDMILSGPVYRPGIQVYGAVSLKDVTVTGFWPGIWAGPGSSVTLGRDTVITGNHSDRLEGGAGIYNDGGSVTLKENATVRDNRAYACFNPFSGAWLAYGGGIYNKGGGSITLEDHSVVSGNEIWHCDSSTWPRFAGWGGGIYTMEGPVVVSGYAQVSGNVAGTGGGVAAGSLGSITLADHATVAGNDASGSGGGVHLFASALTMYDAASISGNTADNGGGISNGHSIVTLNGTATVTGNTASIHGGGIYNRDVGGSSLPAAQVILNDYASVTGNSPDDIYWYP
jgi:hypothetical protein